MSISGIRMVRNGCISNFRFDKLFFSRHFEAEREISFLKEKISPLWSNDDCENLKCTLRNSMIILLVLFFSMAAIAGGPKPSPIAPNVIIILVDDMGYGDIESYGAQPYRTPNLNSLASQGITFTQFYAGQAVCTASRAALLTGCYPTRVGMHGALMPWSKIALNPAEEIIPELLKKKDYKTGIVGKWHLGSKAPYMPLQNGFDEYYGIPYSNDMWPVDYLGKPVTDSTKWAFKHPPLPLIDGTRVVRTINTLEDQSQLTELFTQKAVDFIHRNKDERFFLYLAHPMPHIPIAAGKKFKGKSGAGLYGDVVEEIDWSVGEIMKELERSGIRNNTLVIFTSDNGPSLRYGDHGGSNGGLREGKGTHWDGGLKVPFIASYPGVIPAAKICNQLASNIDLLPTIAALCGASLPVKKIDGVNILDLLTGKTTESPRKDFVYYFDNNNLKAVRTSRWKLVLSCKSLTYRKDLPGRNGAAGAVSYEDMPMALYDLRTDPGENTDVQSFYPETVQALTKIAERYRKELGDGITKTKGNGVRPAAIVK